MVRFSWIRLYKMAEIDSLRLVAIVLEKIGFRPTWNTSRFSPCWITVDTSNGPIGIHISVRDDNLVLVDRFDSPTMWNGWIKIYLGDPHFEGKLLDAITGEYVRAPSG